MAYLSATTNGSTSIIVTINDLTYSASEYVQFQVNNNNTGSQYVWSSGSSSKSTSYTINGLTPNTTYNFTGYANFQGTNYNIGNASAKTSPARPLPFFWSNTKVSGGSFNLTASEWTRLIQNINDVLVYRGSGGYSWFYNQFSNITSGKNFTANMFNEARNAISSGSPSVPVPPSASSGGIVYASMLNGLVNSINSVS